jgi:hypothetical protein
MGHTAHSISQVYVPILFESYIADVEVDGKHIKLALQSSPAPQLS